MTKLARPFLKWAGGKTKLIPHLSNFIPKKYNTYIEPFLGGGALFFKLNHRKSILSDINPGLIDTYSIIKDSLSDLISELQTYKNEKDFFLEIRASTPKEKIKKAARFIYLNKTCFNGLYRENSKGQFNVPFGNYKNPTICDEKNLKEVQKHLAKTLLVCMDFEEACNLAKEGDFVYLDPPYIPQNKSSFTKYNKNGFNLEDHVRLAKKALELKEKKIKVIISNSDTASTRELYKDFNLHELSATQNISAKTKGRQPRKELIIWN